MTIENGGSRFRRATRSVRRDAVALLLVGGGWLVVGSIAGRMVLDRVSAQGLSRRPVADYQVLFAFTQDAKKPNGSSDDQITVIFSNRSVEGPTAPVPLFGEDILQEFSFSAEDFAATNSLRFSRRVRDKTFVEARYIRVVNHGSDGWAGQKISLTVDGEPVLSAVGMYPLRGNSPGQNAPGMIERFNPREWRSRAYWEAELQQYRRAVKK
jgi:hypothetical protein